LAISQNWKKKKGKKKKAKRKTLLITYGSKYGG
jgi:hypothetical protein